MWTWKLFIRSMVGSVILALAAGLAAMWLGYQSGLGAIAKYICWAALGIPGAVCIMVVLHQVMVSMISCTRHLTAGHSKGIGGVLLGLGFFIAACLGGGETTWHSLWPNIIAGVVGIAMMLLGLKLINNSEA